MVASDESDVSESLSEQAEQQDELDISALEVGFFNVAALPLLICGLLFNRVGFA